MRLSFAALAVETRRAARAFLALGIERGDRVAIWAPNQWEWIVAAIGLQSAGAVLVPLNTRFKGREAGYVLRKSRARVLVTVGEFLGTRYVESLAGEELPDLATHRAALGRGATIRASCRGATSSPPARACRTMRPARAHRRCRPTISPICSSRRARPARRRA